MTLVRPTRNAVIAVLALVAAHPRAHAGPAELTGLDASQLALGNPVAIAPDPAGAITGNPANLWGAADGVSVGVVGSHAGRLVRHRARPAGVDVDASIYEARPVDADAALGALATADLPARPGGTDLPDDLLAVVADVRRLGPHAVLGLLAALPTTGAIAPATFYADEREAPFTNAVHLALLEDDRRAAVLAAAIAARPHRRVQLGLGVQLQVGARPENRVYLPNLVRPAESDTNTVLGVAPTVAPTAGVAVTATPWLALQASLRPASAQRVTGQTTIRLWAPEDDELSTSVQPIDFAIDSQPLRIAVGATATRCGWRVAAEAVYRRGADYRDLHAAAPSVAFDDTVEVGAAGWGTLGPAVLRAGLRLVPSPVGAQRGPENHADADRVVAGAGAQVALAPGWSLGLGLGLQRLRSTSVTKDPALIVDEYPDAVDLGGDPIATSAGLQTNNPGYPGYDVGGWIWAAALTLTVERP
ncbi:MAG: hypothetical protein R2939_15600 [Kofleriaceae bacterium]